MRKPFPTHKYHKTAPDMNRRILVQCYTHSVKEKNKQDESNYLYYLSDPS